jgi:hypothetical protein
MRRGALALAACGIAQAAAGQATDPWNGRWHAVYLTQWGEPSEAEVVIREGGGTWLIYSNIPSKYTPCRDQPLPIVASAIDDGRLRFKVDGASLIAGCPVFPVTLGRVDENTLEGTIGKQRPLRLTRE